MFFAMAAVLFLAAALTHFYIHSCLKTMTWGILGIACEVRGFTVGKTFKQTSRKLKTAVEQKKPFIVELRTLSETS